MVHLQNTTAERLRDDDLGGSVQRCAAHQHAVFADSEARTPCSRLALRGSAEGVGRQFPHPLLRKDRLGPEVREHCEHWLQGGGGCFHFPVGEIPAVRPRVFDGEKGDFVFQYALLSVRDLDPGQGVGYGVLYARPVDDFEVKLR